jgi:hypothetical protein
MKKYGSGPKYGDHKVTYGNRVRYGDNGGYGCNKKRSTINNEKTSKLGVDKSNKNRYRRRTIQYISDEEKIGFSTDDFNPDYRQSDYIGSKIDADKFDLDTYITHQIVI